MPTARSLSEPARDGVSLAATMPAPLEEGFQWLERVLCEAEVCSGARVCLLQHALTDLQHLVAYCHATAHPHILQQQQQQQRNGDGRQDNEQPERDEASSAAEGAAEEEDDEELGGLRGRIQQVLGSAREVTQSTSTQGHGNANGHGGGGGKTGAASGVKPTATTTTSGGAAQQSAAASVPKKPPVPNRSGVISKPSSSSSRPLSSSSSSRRLPSSPPARTPRPLPPQHMTPASPSPHPPTPAAAPPPSLSTKRRLPSTQTQRPTTPAQAALPCAPSPEVMSSRLERLHHSTSRLRGVLRELQTQSSSTAGALAGETTGGPHGGSMDEGHEARLHFLRQLAPAWDILAPTPPQEKEQEEEQQQGDVPAGGLGVGVDVDVEGMYGMLDELRSMASAPHRLQTQHAQQVGGRPSALDRMYDRATQALSHARVAVSSASRPCLPPPCASASLDTYLDEFIQLATAPAPSPSAPKPKPTATGLTARQPLNRPNPTQSPSPPASSPLPLPPPPASPLHDLSLTAIQAQVADRLLPVLVQCFRSASARAPTLGPSEGEAEGEWMGLMLAYRAVHTLLTQPTARPNITAVATSAIG